MHFVRKVGDYEPPKKYHYARFMHNHVQLRYVEPLLSLIQLYGAKEYYEIV